MRNYLKFLSVFIFTLFSTTVQAQTSWMDAFNDSNFTSNPQWFGFTNDFIVNGQKQLQLSAPPVTATSSLFTASTAAINASWEFWIKLDFNPSSSNFAQVFLMSSSTNPSQQLNGYYLQFGGSTNDKIWLYRRLGLQNTVVAASADGLLNKSQVNIRVKVNRDAQYNWQISIDSLGGNNFYPVASGVDSLLTKSTYFGLNCVYTSTRSTKFFVDDILVNGQTLVDSKSPTITSSKILGKDEIALTFSEELDSSSAANNANYLLNAPANSISTVQWTSKNPAAVIIKCQNSFSNGQSFTLKIEEVSDPAGNEIKDTILSFRPYWPVYRAIVINEILADPTPVVALPDVEYVELKNNSALDLMLENWKLVNDGDTISLPPFSISAHGFALLINAASSEYDSLNVAKINAGTSWLKNDGEQLVLLDQFNDVIDAFSYNNGLFNGTAKANGGWSLEQITTELACSETSNWRASSSKIGGTPAKENQPEEKYQASNTYFKSAIWIDEFSLIVRFNHALSPENLPIISSTLLLDSVLFFAPQPEQILVKFRNPISQQNSSIFILESNGCDGQFIADTLIFASPSQVGDANIVLNELLFNPREGSADFIELWNISNKTFLLQDLQLANLEDDGTVKSVYTISNENELFLPKSMLVLSTNVEAVCRFYACSLPKNFKTISAFPSMPDAEGHVALTDVAFNVFERVHYSGDWHHPLVSNPEGVSLERIHPSLSSNLQDSWHSAASIVNYASPGKLNSQFTGTAVNNKSITINTNTLSPNNDGLNDVLLITYNLPEESALSLTIFGLNGVRIATIANNILAEKHGEISWNGTDDNGQMNATGLYILLAEWFTPKGEKGMQKLNIAISQ